MESYCTAPECEEPTRQGRAYCELHEKRKQRCRCTSAARCQCLTAPKQERLSPAERLREAALRYAEAEDDAAFQAAARDLVRAARQFGPSTHGELVRLGQAEARRRGVHVGRRPVVDPETACATAARLGSTARAAEALGVSPRTVQRALSRATKAILLSRSKAV
jgi:hypothetical protein